MGADAASLIRNTEFSRETPYILKGRIPTEKIRDGLERIYNAKGNTYEAAVAMTGEMYSLLAVSFGGLSCIAQTYSCISKTDLSLSDYIIHKTILTLFTLLFYLGWRLLFPGSFLS